MKVCHLTSVHPAEDIRIFVKECQSLLKGGHDVSLIVANQKTYTKDGIKIISVQTPSSNRYIRMMKSIIGVYKEAVLQNADVYHFHDPELMPVGLLLKGKGKKVIYDVHEDVPEQVLSKQWIPSFLRKPISKIVKQIEQFASKRFDAIVTATPTINNRFKTYNSNSVIVHNFPILNELLDQNETTKSKSFEEPSIVYVGGITTLRGIEEMGQAIQLVNNTHNVNLVLAGNFMPNSLETETKDKSYWKYFDFKGFVSREGIKEILSKSTLGLVILHPEPRYVVSYPIKLFEYMSAGIPVVASNFPIWRDIVEGENCGKCVDPLNPEEIAQTINWFINHPDEAKQMGENGRTAIQTKYNWEAESKTLNDLYSKLAAM